MRQYKILVIHEDELHKSGSFGALCMNTHVLVEKANGDLVPWKDRWEYPTNTNVVNIYLPRNPSKVAF